MEVLLNSKQMFNTILYLLKKKTTFTVCSLEANHDLFLFLFLFLSFIEFRDLARELPPRRTFPFLWGHSSGWRWPTAPDSSPPKDKESTRWDSAESRRTWRTGERLDARPATSSRCPASSADLEASTASTTSSERVWIGRTRTASGCCWKGGADAVAVVAPAAGLDHSELWECFFRPNLKERSSEKLRATNWVWRRRDREIW